MKVHLIVSVIILSSLGNGSDTTYDFYRSINAEHGEDTRRIFGGNKAGIEEFPRVCLLTDEKDNAQCTGTVIANNWVLTAGHCTLAKIQRVKYNSRTPYEKDTLVAYIRTVYRHPDYKVVQEDEGRGMDVTILHHDIGLVKTLEPFVIMSRITENPIEHLRTPQDLYFKEVKVIGFGRTENTLRRTGEELFSVRLMMQGCERSTWFHCMCGVASPGEQEKGVCSGDSGGPVLYNGEQVAVTSMGPVECKSTQRLYAGATSVFTSLREYVDVINDTVMNNPGTLKLVPFEIAVGSTANPHEQEVCLVLFVAVACSLV